MLAYLIVGAALLTVGAFLLLKGSKASFTMLHDKAATLGRMAAALSLEVAGVLTMVFGAATLLR